MQKYGFVLGGGAARGLAHIGIMKAFYKNNIQPDVIAGTSMGAIIGSLLAAGYDPEEIEQEVRDINVLSMVDFSWKKSGIFSGEKVYAYLKKFLGEKQFSDLKIPLTVCALDVESGETIFFSEGSVLEAVRASMSIPGVFVPVETTEHMLVDGGIVNNLPINALDQFDCKHTIAISVRRSLNTPVLYRKYLEASGEWFRNFKYPRHSLIFDIMKKSYDILVSQQEKYMAEEYPNVPILMPNMDQFEYADFLKKDEILDISLKEGERLVEEYLSLQSNSSDV